MEILDAVTGAFGTLVVGYALYRLTQKEADLQIIDVVIDEKDSRYGLKLPVIDVTVRNNGARTAGIKRVELTLYNVWPLAYLDPLAMHLESSATYDIQLPSEMPTNKMRDVLQQTIHQSIKSHETDRFRVELAANHRLETIYHFSISLIYNENDKKVDGRDLIFTAPYFGPNGLRIFMQDAPEVEESYKQSAVELTASDPNPVDAANQVFSEDLKRRKEQEAVNKYSVLKAGRIKAVRSERFEYLLRRAESV